MDITVVIPLYNEAESLPELFAWIERVMKENHFTYEVIFINDGSTDNSGNICGKYLSLDARVRYYYTDNSGVSSARNLGLELAKGEYVTFYDSDDFLKETDSLEIIYNYAKKYGMLPKNTFKYWVVESIKTIIYSMGLYNIYKAILYRVK